MFNSNLQSGERIPLLNNKGSVCTIEQVLPIRKIKYPIAVVFVLATKFFEAFAANGIRTILALYLRDDLSFTESFSTVILHVFNFFGQFCPIFGAIVADNYIGNTRAVSYFYLIYATGWGGFILTSFPFGGLPVIFLVSLSLLFISIGNGSIRACITSLGALQFTIPEQKESLTHYFSHYYFVYYIGIFLSKILPPLVRAKTSCFQKTGCYPAVFSVLGSAFLASCDTFLIGKYFYKTEYIEEDNVIVKFYGCIKHALTTKLRKRHTVRRQNWLHYAVGKYSEEFVEDVAKFLKVSKLFLPLPIYYALLAQQDSTWTFQAAQLNTTILGINIQPDQAKAMGPIFLFSMIPLWQYIIYPILCYYKIFIHPLHSVAIGGICSALSFVSSGILQIYIESIPIININIAWQIPQFVLLMMGELFLSIPGLHFAFTEAPQSMKSMLTATWFLNNAFGNLIVVVLTEIQIVELQSSMYFIYAALMFLSIMIFTVMACNYLKPSTEKDCTQTENC